MKRRHILILVNSYTFIKLYPKNINLTIQTQKKLQKRDIYTTILQRSGVSSPCVVPTNPK